MIFDGLKLIRYIRFGDSLLYDLEADPLEQQNIAPNRPDDVGRGIALLEARHAAAASRRRRLGVVKSTPMELTAGEKQMLRSLGYVQ